jgi:hypothetical protein
MSVAWDDTDSEEEYNDEEVMNETPPQGVDDEFKKKVRVAKRSLYQNIVLAPQLGTKNAQNNQILNQYLNKLNSLYVMAINAQSGRFVEGELSSFPAPTQAAIKDMIHAIMKSFKENNVPDVIPYADYIKKMLHEYQFLQK